MNPSSDLVNKLWRLCALLRKDGVTYQQYVTELTYLLFLKMASEQKDESRIPAEYRWGNLKSCNEAEVLQRYRQALVDLGDIAKVGERSIVAIFQNAATIIREPANLRKLIDAIDAGFEPAKQLHDVIVFDDHGRVRLLGIDATHVLKCRRSAAREVICRLELEPALIRIDSSGCAHVFQKKRDEARIRRRVEQSAYARAATHRGERMRILPLPVEPGPLD